MSKVHFPRNAEQYTRLATGGTTLAHLAMPAACGQRTTDRVTIDLSTDPEVVDCEKCRGRLPETTIEEQMRTAYAAGDLEEVVRLSKAL